MRIVNRIFNAAHENHESQLNFIFTLIDYFLEKLEKVHIELSSSKVTIKKVFDHLQKGAIYESNEKISSITFYLVSLIQ